MVDCCSRRPDKSSYRELLGNSVNKTSRLFSSMAEDQAHEQHNKLIKDDSGAVGIFDNNHAIPEWAIAGPVISKMLNSSTSQDATYHHEDTSAYEGKFKNDCAALHETFGNPFKEEEPGLVQFTSKKVLANAAADSVREAFQIGKEQYTKFSRESGSLYDSIKRTSCRYSERK